MPQDIISFSTTPGSNSTIGTSISVAENCAIANWNNAVRELMANLATRLGSSFTLASATTPALGDQEEEYGTISGTTTITGFGTPTTSAGKYGFEVVFSGVLTLTHNATSLILPGGANITTAAGDTARFRHEGSGNWRCLWYQKASGAAITGFSKTDITGQSAITAIDGAADYLVVSDGSDSGNLKKVLGKYVSPIVARAYAEYTTNADITTVLPSDDTVPVSTEGVETHSISITTVNATQRVRLRFFALVSSSGVIDACAALFRGTTNIAATANKLANSSDSRTQLYLEVEDAPGAAGTYTYSARVGPGTAGTIRLNGTGSSRWFGGSSKSTLVAEVIEP